ncbi:histidine phosphatase family protein [Streptococcus dentiloxodontae]
MKLYLMRHGETLFNTQGRVQGWSDSPLTEKGLQQAEDAKRYFEDAGICFEAVFSSTQERATDTAKLVAKTDRVKQLKGIKEMNFGSFEAQPEQLLPRFRQGSRSFEDLLVPYGGEAISQVGKRVLKTVLEAADALDNGRAKNLLFVSHGAALWGLILELDLVFPEGVTFGNCAICEYDYQNGQLTLIKVIDPISQKEVIL